MARTDQHKQLFSWTLLALITLGTRLATRVGYHADPDSLRFLQGLYDFDIVALQPHFPGYPVFIALARLFDLPGWDPSVTFALVGSLATLLTVYGVLRLLDTTLTAADGVLAAYLVLFTPMIWTMGVRHMPDLLGTAVALIGLVLLVRRDYQRESLLLLGIGVTGLLAGVRLSYLPLLAIPLLIGLIRAPRKGHAVAVLILSVAIWLLPMILDTGPGAFIEAAERQSSGHFTDFGGTIGTLPDLDLRRVSLLQGIVADGFGGYWRGRPLITLLMIVGLLGLFARGVWWIFTRDIDGLLTIALSMVVYIAWILLYQNVVYQPRHVLPLLPLLLAPIWAGARVLLSRGWFARLATSLLLALLAVISTTLALQHRGPTAIAQVAEYLRGETGDETTIASTRLITWQLQRAGVEGRYSDVDSVAATEAAIVVGWFLPDSALDRYQRLDFYHNPYVNRIWPEIPLWMRRVDIDRRVSGE